MGKKREPCRGIEMSAGELIWNAALVRSNTDSKSRGERSDIDHERAQQVRKSYVLQYRGCLQCLLCYHGKLHGMS